MAIELKLDKSKFFERIGYKPHSLGQQAIHDSQALRKIACCGRRYGKSLTFGTDMGFECLQPEKVFWIVGPTYKLAEKEFRVVHNIYTKRLELTKSLKIAYNAEQGHMRIKFPWDTVLQCASATNPDSLLGEGLHGVIMSEAARHEMATWEQYIEPALSDEGGFAWFPSTPKGFNWFQGLWQLGQMPDMEDYESWRLPTWENTIKYPGGYDNPRLTQIRNIVSPAFWKQEYAAEFTSFEGQIYEEFDPGLHVVDIAYNPSWRNYCVFDYGFNDPFVCLDIMVDPSDNVYVWREYQSRYKTTWEHAHVIRERENPEGYHIDGMFGDPAGADEAATLALVIGRVTARKVPWIQGVEAVKRKLKIQPNGLPQLFIDRSCINLIRQMQALRHKVSKTGHNAKEGQVDFDDHGPDALRYFIGEFFVLGAGMSLSDVYDTSLLGSEAETFFTLRRGLSLDTQVGHEWH
jgi:hypothetical protein